MEKINECLTNGWNWKLIASQSADHADVTLYFAYGGNTDKIVRSGKALLWVTGRNLHEAMLNMEELLARN